MRTDVPSPSLAKPVISLAGRDGRMRPSSRDREGPMKSTRLCLARGNAFAPQPQIARRYY
jgi:hypothetical protein